jgi:hypothetical protein
MSAPTCIVVCAGKDCRNAKGFAKLRRTAAGVPGSMEAPCQGLCHGPIVGLRVGGDIRWVSRVRSAKMRAALVKAAARGQLGKRLRAREVRARRGVLRAGRRLSPLT